MISRYKEIFFGLLLGLAMWMADALMHTMMSAASQGHRPALPALPALVEELLFPEGTALIFRLLYAGCALCAGWLLWRSNRRERAALEMDWRLANVHERMIYQAAFISNGSELLLRGGELTGQGLASAKEIGNHARLIEEFVKSLPDLPGLRRQRGAGVARRRRLSTWARKIALARSAPMVGAVSLMVAAGLTIRLIVVAFAYGEQLLSPRGDFEFGWEMGRVARSLAAGDGFSSPLWGDTGPTAWIPPVYALLLAGVFKLFGIYTAGSAIAILSLNSLFSALTSIPVFYIAQRLFGFTVAILAGWCWALFPFAFFIAAFRVWGESLDALLVSSILLMTLRLASTNRLAVWVGCGLLTGVAALTNPNTLSVIPGLWGWACYELRLCGSCWKKPLLVAATALALAVAPWFVRNRLVFDQLLPLRSNFWLEVSLGNNPAAATMMTGDRHPASNKAEMEEYRRLGEMEYMAEKRRQALAFMTADPESFIWLTARRMVFVWTGFWSLDPRYLASEPLQLPLIFFNTALFVMILTGLSVAWRNRDRKAIPLAIMLVCQPLVYYVTHPAIEYRHAIDPAIVVLAVFGAVRFRARHNASHPGIKNTRYLSDIAQGAEAHGENGLSDITQGAEAHGENGLSRFRKTLMGRIRGFTVLRWRKGQGAVAHHPGGFRRDDGRKRNGS